MLPAHQENSYSILALHPHENQVSPNVQAFVDHLASCMGRVDRMADNSLHLNGIAADSLTP